MEKMENIKRYVRNINISGQSIFIGLIVVQFLFIFLLNVLTGYSGDDFGYARDNDNLIEAIQNEYYQYLNWGGRNVAHLTARIFLMLPKVVFNVLNSIVYVSVTLLMYGYMNFKKYRPDIYLFIIVTCWLFFPQYGEAVFWITGACNYLWGLFWILLSLFPFARYLDDSNSGKNTSITFLVMQTVISLLAGWCNENTSGGLILFMLFCLIYYKVVQGKTIRVWMVSSLVASIIGFLIMVLAPGNAIRTQVVIAEGTDVSLAYKMARITFAVEEYWLYLLIAITILIIYYCCQKQIGKIILPIVYTMIAFAVAYALLLSPLISKRALFGATGFLIIAITSLISNLDVWKHKMTISIIVTFLTWYCLFSLFGVCVATITTYQEYSVQMGIIEQAQHDGLENVIVPEIEKRTVYSGFIDILTDDPDYWTNRMARKYYGLDSLVASNELYMELSNRE